MEPRKERPDWRVLCMPMRFERSFLDKRETRIVYDLYRLTVTWGGEQES